MTSKKTILVTGSAGFIGFHTSLKLHELKHNVVGVDNFNDYYDPQLKVDRATLLSKQAIPTLNIDINDYQAMSDLIAKENVTHILHLAAQAGVRYSLENPKCYVESNLSGFCNILELCRQYKLPLVYASSSSVYGKNKKIPFSIDDRTDAPASFYGATKKCNEILASSYHSLFNIPMVGLRFFTVYGPWGRPDMAYFSFSKKILDGETIDIYNHGKMKRDFTYIDDIVDGIVASLDQTKGQHIYNLGNNNPEELETFIHYLENSLDCKAKTRMLPMQLGDVESTFADIELSKRDLNFSPKVSLKEGLLLFANWYKDYYKKEVKV